MTQTRASIRDNKMRKPLISLAGALLMLNGASLSYAENLTDIYRLAQESDPQLRAAEAGYRATQEARPQSRAALLPNIGFSANVTNNETDVEASSFGSTGSSSYSSNGYSLSLQQAIYHHDYYVQLRQADSRIASAEAQFGSARQGLILRVADAYFNRLAAQDNLAFAEAEKRAISQQLRQTQQRFKVGLNAITDVHEAQARFDAAVAQEIAAKNQLDVATEALREITAKAHSELAPMSDNMPLIAPEPADINQWVDTAMKQNLQLLAAEADANTAREETRRRRAGHLPTLDLVASHSYSDNTDSPTFGSEQTNTNLSLQLNIPIYAGGGISSQEREGEALYQQAMEALEQQRRATVRETRSAYLNVMAGISSVKAFKQALSSANTALEATQAGFEVGTRTAVDVLDSQRELFRAQRDYARARYDYALATLQLKQAAGVLSEQDLNQINGWLN